MGSMAPKLLQHRQALRREITTLLHIEHRSHVHKMTTRGKLRLQGVPARSQLIGN